MRREVRWMVAILLLAFGLRLVGLATRPLWYDEAFSLLMAEQGLDGMLTATLTPENGAASEEHPLGYYLALRGWTGLVGRSVGAARLLSVFSGVLTVALGFVLGQWLFGRRVGVVTAVILTLSPFQLAYAQEVRMYALLTLWVALLMTLAWWAAARDGWRPWVGLGLVGGLALHTHSVAWLFVTAVGVWLVLAARRQPRFWMRLGAAGGVMLVVVLPWLVQLPAQVGKLGTFWTTRPGLLALVQALIVVHVGSDNQALPVWLLGPALFLSVLVPLLGLVALRRWAGDRRRLLLPLLVCLLPVVGLLLASLVRPVWVVRALLPAAFGYALLIAALLTGPPTPRWLRGAVGITAVVVMLLSLMSHFAYEGFPRVPVDDLHTAVVDEPLIIHTNKLTYLPLFVADRDLPQVFVLDAPGSATDTFAAPTRAVFGVRGVVDVAKAEGHERVTVVVFQRELDEVGAHPQLAWLAERYGLVKERPLGPVRLFTFEQSQNPAPDSPN